MNICRIKVLLHGLCDLLQGGLSAGRAAALLCLLRHQRARETLIQLWRTELLQPLLKVDLSSV